VETFHISNRRVIHVVLGIAVIICVAVWIIAQTDSNSRGDANPVTMESAASDDLSTILSMRDSKDLGSSIAVSRFSDSGAKMEPVALRVRVTNTDGSSLRSRVALQVYVSRDVVSESCIDSETDSSGFCTMEFAPPCVVRCTAVGGSNSVSANIDGVVRIVDVELQLESNSGLVGLVMLDDGRPAANASIYRIRHGQSANVIARTNAEGEFSLLGIPRGAEIMAASVDYGVSSIYRVSGELSQRPRFVMRGGGWLRLRAISLDDRGFKDVEFEVDAFDASSGPSRSSCWIRRRMDGQEVVVSLPAGEANYRILMAGQTIAVGVAAIGAGSTVTVSFDLPLVRSVAGRVTWNTGESVGVVRVHLSSEDGRGVLSARTDAEGFFTINTYLSRARLTVVGLPGPCFIDTVVLDPQQQLLVLVPRLNRFVRVESVDGSPLVGWSVVLKAKHAGGGYLQAHTDDRGTAAFPLTWSELSPEVSIRRAGDSLRVPPLLRTRLNDSDDTKLVVVDEESFGSLSGRLSNHAGSITLIACDGSGRIAQRVVSRSFRFVGVPPNTYDVVFDADRGYQLRVGRATIVSGDSIELGDIDVARVGRVAVDLRASPKLACGSVAKFKSADFGAMEFDIQSTEWPIDIPTGNWVVGVFAGGAMRASRSVDVVSSSEVQIIQFDFGDAFDVLVRIGFASTLDVSDAFVSLRCRMTGEQIASSLYAAEGRRDLQWRCVLTAGEWDLVVRCADGRTNRAKFVVDGLAANATEIAVEVATIWPSTGSRVKFDFSGSKALLDAGRIRFSVRNRESNSVISGIAFLGESRGIFHGFLEPGHYSLFIGGSEAAVSSEFWVRSDGDCEVVVR
jgi:hypothetical protein